MRGNFGSWTNVAEEGIKELIAVGWILLIVAAFGYEIYAWFLSESLPFWRKIGGGIWLGSIIYSSNRWEKS